MEDIMSIQFNVTNRHVTRVGLMLKHKYRILCGIAVCLLMMNFIVSLTTSSDPSDNAIATDSEYLKSEDAMLFIGNQDLEESGLPGNGTAGNPFVITNLIIETGGDNIDIQNTDYHVLISNCTIDGTSGLGSGVHLTNTSNIVVSNCTINSKIVGIEIVDSEETKILNTSFVNTTDAAINLYNSTQTSCFNNTIYNCRGGISVQYSYYTEIKDNWIELSSEAGISIGASRYGIITGNVILGSTTYGIIFEGGAGRFNIFDNTLGWNRVANALDDGSSNLWDDGVSRGNKYSDYHGAALYSINGDAGSVDNYPSEIAADFWFPPWRDAEAEQVTILVIIAGLIGVGVVISGYLWRSIGKRDKLGRVRESYYD